MKLAIFTSQFPGRINTFFARDVRGLVDAGVDVEVFAIHPLDDDLWSYVPDLLSEDVLPRTKIHHVSVPRSLKQAIGTPRAWGLGPEAMALTAAALPHGLSTAFKTAYVVPKALGWVRDHGARFDHVLAYWGNYAATCAYLFHRASGRPVPFSTFLHAGTDLYRSRVYLRQKLSYADNIIVVCDFNRQFLQSSYPATFDRWAPKIYLHHLGLDLGELTFREDGRIANRVIAVGGLHAAKGFDDLVRAAADMRRNGRAIDVVIVGDGPEGPALRQLADALGVGGDVTFLGWQVPDRVVAEIRQAAVLVHPSIGLGDAVPTVIKEAMALGTPVVASAVAGIPELLDDGRCGVLTPPRQPAALAAALAALVPDPGRRRALALLARQRAEALFSQTRNGAALADRLRRTPGRVPVASSAAALANSQRINQ